MPALGLGENRADRSAPSFGLDAAPEHRPNDSRFAFAAESRAEVNRLADIAVRAGARVDGNKFEICCRW